jgi:4a-hydroxytetrahydrobiopterin dehydratase
MEVIMKLMEQKCEPIKAGAPPLNRKDAEALLLQVPDWSLNDGEIVREFKFKDFRQAMNFVDRIAGIANEQDHHPDILISYNTVRLSLSTHKIGGLSMNDFILAAKIDAESDRQISGKAA